MTATKDKDNHYAYNTVTVVLLTEFVKLLVAVGLQLRTYVKTLQRFPHCSLFTYANIAFIQIQSSFVHREKTKLAICMQMQKVWDLCGNLAKTLSNLFWSLFVILKRMMKIIH